MIDVSFGGMRGHLGEEKLPPSFPMFDPKETKCHF
jgi:hypothetical protein